MKPGVYTATVEAVRPPPPPRCRAAHHNGYVCEHRDGLGHAGPHVGGDYKWYGTTPWRERQNKVLEVLCTGDATVTDLVEATGLPRRTVRRMLDSLRREGLARRKTPYKTTAWPSNPGHILWSCL